MSHAFTLAAIVPNDLTIDDPVTGSSYKVKRVSEMGALDVAKLQRLQKRIFPQGTSDITEVISDEMAARVDEATLDLVKLLCPSMPDATLARMSFTEKVAFFAWWTNENKLQELAARPSIGDMLDKASGQVAKALAQRG